MTAPSAVGTDLPDSPAERRRERTVPGVSEVVEEAGLPVRVTVLVRARCTTCDRMEDVVRQVCADAGVGWERVDIDTADAELRGEFGDRIPVTLVDGEEHATWRVDPDALRTALRT
jgi:glutaredoxin-like protein DUF836